jgi:hypothetical protein
MDVITQRDHVINFFRRNAYEFFDHNISIVTLKGDDYAPEKIAMTEAFFTAAEIDATVPQILYVHVKKHMSAIAKYMTVGHLKSEDLRSRLSDVANYMALIDSYMVDPIAWLKHLDRLIALSDFPTRTPEEMQTLHRWMRRQMVLHGVLPEAPLPLDR